MADSYCDGNEKWAEEYESESVQEMDFFITMRKLKLFAVIGNISCKSKGCFLIQQYQVLNRRSQVKI